MICVVSLQAHNAEGWGVGVGGGGGGVGGGGGKRVRGANAPLRGSRG